MSWKRKQQCETRTRIRHSVSTCQAVSANQSKGPCKNERVGILGSEVSVDADGNEGIIDQCKSGNEVPDGDHIGERKMRIQFVQDEGQLILQVILRWLGGGTWGLGRRLFAVYGA